MRFAIVETCPKNKKQMDPKRYLLKKKMSKEAGWSLQHKHIACGSRRS